jgi:2-keto-3-deoxy-6-phosphogluconate aldolase
MTSRLREELHAYLSLPGALCVVAGGWLYLAAQHCNEEARRVSQAYVLDGLSGETGHLGI